MAAVPALAASSLMIEHVSFGIVIDDIVLRDGTHMLGMLGGGGPQTAWGMAAALGSGVTVGIVAVVGRDCTPEILRPLERAGVDLGGLSQNERLTPRAWQRFDPDGEREHIWRVPPLSGKDVYQTALDSLPEAYRGARDFHWGLHPENPTLEHARRFLELNKRVSLETFRPPENPLTPEALRDLAASCLILSPGWYEAVGMVGNDDMTIVLEALRDAGCQILSLRRGPDGADVWDFRGAEPVGWHVPAVPTKVIDTTGAGNAFAGALLVRLDDGISTAAAHASAAASFMIEQFGIPDRLPSADEYKRRRVFAQTEGFPLNWKNPTNDPKTV